MTEIKINYFDPDMPKLQIIQNGDWIDLRTAVEVKMDKGEYQLIPLGVAMKLPEGYEAHVLPRSSTANKHGILLANSQGVIDNSYCGANDQWCFPAVAFRDTLIPKYTRIAQFRIVENQPKIQFVEVSDSEMGKDRGGVGSTGEV